MINGVTFIDFEGTAVSINNANVLTIKNCDVVRNRQEVPGRKQTISIMICCYDAGSTNRDDEYIITRYEILYTSNQY